MAKYQYSYVELPYVIKNPEEYIIPECLEACKSLWNKNIETFMCSNDDDNNLYILVMNLSDKNLETMKRLVEENKNYFYSSSRNCYGIKVDDKSRNQVEKLNFLTEVFSMQDTKRFISGEDFLSNYKTTGGEVYIDEEDYSIRYRENPKLKNATLEEAIKETGKENLYIASENRVYSNELFLKWHKRYMDSLIQKDVKTYELKDNIDN